MCTDASKCHVTIYSSSHTVRSARPLCRNHVDSSMLSKVAICGEFTRLTPDPTVDHWTGLRSPGSTDTTLTAEEHPAF